MGHKRSRAAGRAWRLLRLALLWAGKGGVLKCRLMSELRHVPKHLKALHRHSSGSRRLDAIQYGERELSFDDTPVIRLGMSRPASLRFKMPNIPCIKPSVTDFDCDFAAEDEADGRRSFLASAAELEEYCDYEIENGAVEEGKMEEEEEEEEEEEIDGKADEFIAKFYEQMKFQRQISYLEYEEMLCRGSSQ